MVPLPYWRSVFAVACSLLLIDAAKAEVFQWMAPVSTGETVDKEGKTHAKSVDAYLWVPAGADRIRGVLIGGDVLFEAAFVKDPAIRKACAEEKLAIVQFVGSIDAIFNYKAEGFKGGEYLQNALDALGNKSGYRELSVAPWFPYGHSVSTMWACHIATWRPDRTFGFLSFKGGVDTGTDPENYAGIPALIIKGEFEEFGPAGPLRRELKEDRTTSWTVMKETLVSLRAKDDRNLFSALLEPGATHFRWADDSYGEYVAKFLSKAARKRIPDWPVDAKEVKCLPVDPTTGALSSSNLFDGKRPEAAAYSAYSGDKKTAFWHLDVEMAQATDAFYAKNRLGKKAQFVTFSDPRSGLLINVGSDLRLNFSHAWTGPDTFKVSTGFFDKVPSFYPPVDAPIGHAEGAIKVYPYTGVVEQVGPYEFRPTINGRRAKIEKDKDGKAVINIRCDLVAVHPGDETYRHAEQMGRNKGLGSPKGKDQTITFDPLPKEVEASAGSVKLKATSDSGLPVRFYVESGPAEIEGDTLKIADVPGRGDAFEVKVVAWQFGSQTEPKYSPAEPVAKTILVRAHAGK